MAVRYGVLIGRVIETKEERNNDTPHYQVIVDAGDQGHYRVPINVRSKGREHPELLYYADENFDAHQITILPNMNLGFHEINYHQNINEDIAVDFIRSALFDPSEMEIIPNNVAGPDNDLNDFIDKHMQEAKNNDDATFYAFGFHFNDGKGVHNIHMNQGNSRISPKENDIFHDGCVLVHFKNENKWVAYFLAFQSQSWCTNDQGYPIEGSVDMKGFPTGSCTYNTVHIPAQGEYDSFSAGESNL